MNRDWSNKHRTSTCSPDRIYQSLHLDPKMLLPLNTEDEASIFLSKSQLSNLYAGCHHPSPTQDIILEFFPLLTLSLLSLLQWIFPSTYKHPLISSTLKQANQQPCDPSFLSSHWHSSLLSITADSSNKWYSCLYAFPLPLFYLGPTPLRLPSSPFSQNSSSQSHQQLASCQI